MENGREAESLAKRTDLAVELAQLVVELRRLALEMFLHHEQSLRAGAVPPKLRWDVGIICSSVIAVYSISSSVILLSKMLSRALLPMCLCVSF